ncbi:MAG: hypothetical protein O7G85_15250 [Planctomycetota bacterium]|nr:hypothetical protein [Planctomycetota bacterium]
MHVSRNKTTTMALLAACLLGSSAALANENEAKHAALAIPAQINLGNHLASADTPGKVWLINRSDEMIHLVKIKGNCGCITLPNFEPISIDPHHAIPIEFSIKAPKVIGKEKTKTLKMIFRDHEALEVSVTIAAVESPGEVVIEDEPKDAHKGLIAVPGILAYGEVEANSVHDGEAWLINTASQAIKVTGAKGGCGCSTMPAFETMTLASREARLVKFTIEAPKKDGKEKATAITFTIAGADPLKLPITMNTPDARVARASSTTK